MINGIIHAAFRSLDEETAIKLVAQSVIGETPIPHVWAQEHIVTTLLRMLGENHAQKEVLVRRYKAADNCLRTSPDFEYLRGRAGGWRRAA